MLAGQIFFLNPPQIAVLGVPADDAFILIGDQNAVICGLQSGFQQGQCFFVLTLFFLGFRDVVVHSDKTQGAGVHVMHHYAGGAQEAGLAISPVNTEGNIQCFPRVQGAGYGSMYARLVFFMQQVGPLLRWCG